MERSTAANGEEAIGNILHSIRSGASTISDPRAIKSKLVAVHCLARASGVIAAYTVNLIAIPRMSHATTLNVWFAFASGTAQRRHTKSSQVTLDAFYNNFAELMNDLL